MKLILTEKEQVKTQDERVVAEKVEKLTGKEIERYWNAFHPNSPLEMKLVSDDYVPYKVVPQINTKLVEKLLNLMKNNPQLNVIPFVEGEMSEETTSLNMVDIVDCYLDKVYYFQGEIFLHSKNYDYLVEKEISRTFGTARLANDGKQGDWLDVDRLAKAVIDQLDWEKVIIVEMNS